MSELADAWYQHFIKIVQDPTIAEKFQAAVEEGQLNLWTEAVTEAAIGTCSAMEWQASAIGHKFSLLPISRSEYLSLDGMAFDMSGIGRWQFPVAVFEFENNIDYDSVAYSLWKLLCVHSALRVVICYARAAEETPNLICHLENDVVAAMGVADRASLPGQSLIIVGAKDKIATFPYGFFKPWLLDANTGRFMRL